MPMYDFKCECGHTHEAFKKMNDPAPECPKCGGVCHVVPARFSAEREWHGRESVSMALRFDKAHEAEVAADVPSIKLNDDGFAVFTSDSHQRRVYRELEAAKNRYVEKDREKNRKKDSRAERVSRLAKKLEAKFGSVIDAN